MRSRERNPHRASGEARGEGGHRQVTSSSWDRRGQIPSWRCEKGLGKTPKSVGYSSGSQTPSPGLERALLSRAPPPSPMEPAGGGLGRSKEFPALLMLAGQGLSSEDPEARISKERYG